MAVRLAMLYGLKCWAIKKLCPKNWGRRNENVEAIH